MLEIKTGFDRQTVRIDSKDYQLKSPKEIKLDEFLWMREKGVEIAKAAESNTFTAKHVNSIKKTMDKIIDKILIAPIWIKRKLNYQHKMAVISFFLTAVNKNTSEMNSTKSSPDSNVSMAAE